MGEAKEGSMMTKGLRNMLARGGAAALPSPLPADSLR
jgi:hypothetical protein